MNGFPRLLRMAQDEPPAVALVLGSGMGGIVAGLRQEQSVPYLDVPGLAAPTVPGHGGRLTLGDWAGQRILVFAGRPHFYECGLWRSVTAPVRIAQFLGARTLLLTNAAGGIRDDLQPGSLLVLRDQLEWTRPNAWREPPAPTPYAPHLRRLLHAAAADQGIALAEGVYGAVTGPCYETPAEIRALRVCGADAVGMSTAREARAASAAGLACAAVSLITNRAAGLSAGPLCHDEVLAAARTGADQLAQLLEALLRRLPAGASATHGTGEP